MDGERALRGSGLGDRQFVQDMGGAAGRRNFGADDVDGRRTVPPRPPIFGYTAPNGRHAQPSAHPASASGSPAQPIEVSRWIFRKPAST